MSDNVLEPQMGMEQERRGRIAHIEQGPNPEVKREEISWVESQRIVDRMVELTGGGVKGYSYNGGRFYLDNQAPEDATAECNSPSQLATCVGANNLLFEQSVRDVIRQIAVARRKDIVMRFHHRVVDSEDHSHASHLNISVPDSLGYKIDTETEYRPQILDDAASRSFIAGAGRVRQDGTLHYSQKRSVKYEHMDGHMSQPTVYDVRYNSNSMHKRVETRFEYRDGDKNFSDWQVMVNAASAVGMLAIMQTPLLEHFPEHELEPYRVPSEVNPINILNLNPDGTIRPNKALEMAVGRQLRKADIMIDEFDGQFADLTDEYRFLYGEMRRYCQDFRRVLAGDATIELLADRVDWAARFQFILDKMEGRSDCEFGDLRTRCADLLYDVYEVKIEGGEEKILWGQGYRLRKAGKFALTVSENDITIAKTTPPAGTRAAERVELMQTMPGVTHASWVEVGAGNKYRRLTSLRAA